MADEPVSLREHLEALIEERDKRYTERAEQQDKAVQAALAAQKELTSSAFQSSERAITKAEAAQSDYNVRSNEFRGQLDDQAKLLMPRTEAMGLLKALEDKMSVNRDATEKAFYDIREDIKSLRESRSGGAGKSAGLNAGWVYLIGAVTLIGAIVALAVKLR